MTQASSQAKPDTKTTTPTPGATHTAATTATGAKPGDKPPGDKPPGTNGTPAGGGNTDAAPAAKKGSSRIFIATGPVYEFETTAKAEKFLNGGGETPAPAEYAVIRGKRIGTSKKVSLR